MLIAKNVIYKHSVVIRSIVNVTVGRDSSDYSVERNVRKTQAKCSSSVLSMVLLQTVGMSLF